MNDDDERTDRRFKFVAVTVISFIVLNILGTMVLLGNWRNLIPLLCIAAGAVAVTIVVKVSWWLSGKVYK